jgi:hypothetical protein
MPVDLESFVLGVLASTTQLLLVLAAVLAIVAVIAVAALVWSLLQLAIEQARAQDALDGPVLDPSGEPFPGGRP